MKKNNIVYSTDPDYQQRCPVCDKPLDDCICVKRENNKYTGQTIRIRREVKGRGGKTVTTLSGFGSEAREMQKELQKLCGAGGTVKQSVVEIQGDQREKIRDYLQKQGYEVKLAGG